MLHGVLRFLRREFFAGLASELVFDGRWAHVHFLLVRFGLSEGIGIVIGLEMVHSVLASFGAEFLAGLAGELLVCIMSE